MPSTYTTNNGLEKIGTGEQSGTWGDTTNLNFDILDQALDGLVTITATDTGSSGSPNSLPITDGTLSDGRNRLIIITDGGDLGGSVYYQLTPADAEKIVFLRNSLSGSRDLILFQGSYNAARDLIVPAGKDVIVKFSGTGTSTAVVAPVFADLSLDAATIASADINGGTIDGVTIGVTSVATVINVDNLKLDGNTLSSTDTNGNVVLAPNGDGDVQLDADTVRVGDNNNDVTITTNGTGDLTLNTNGGTNSGSIEIQDGVNTNIIVTANGTGKLELANGDITTSASSGSDAAGQDLTIQAGASTGNAAGGDMIFQTTPAGAGSGSVLNSYTTVLTLTDDSKMQIGTSTAVDSILDEDDMTSDSATALATQQSIKAYVDAQVGANNELSEVLANGNTTGGTDIAVSTGDDITFADNSKATFGAGSDLQIFHDVGGTSHIRESGSSHLYIEATNLRLKSSTDTGETYLTANVDGAVSLYYDNAPKLATTSTGIDVTGTVTADGLTVDGTSDLNGTITVGTTYTTDITGNNISFFRNNGASYIQQRGGYALAFQTNDGSDRTRLSIESNGDISFYENTGTTAKFFWDADAESLGIGTSSPDKAIHVKTAVNNTAFVKIESTATDSYPTLSLKNDAREYQLTAHGPLGDKFTIYDGTAGSHRLVIDSSGNVGIGTSSPNAQMELWGAASTYNFNAGTDPLANLAIINNNVNSGTGPAIVLGSVYTGSAAVANARIFAERQSTGSTNAGATDLIFEVGQASGSALAERMRIDSSGRVKLHEDLVQDEVKATTTATTQVAIDTFPHASYDGAKVVITAATSADTYVTELLIATNGTTAVATEYGQIGTGSALATYDVDISGADVRILATPASTTSTTFRVAMTLT